MRRSQIRLAILLVAGALLAQACNSFNPFHTADDKAITTSIQAKLFSDPVLKTRDVRVDSHQGVVTLSGSVGTELEKSAVERIAGQEDGVKNVVDMLAVNSEPVGAGGQAAPVGEPPTPQAVPADGQVAANEPARPARHHKPAAAREQAAAEPAAYVNSQTAEPASNPAAAPAAPAAPQVAAAPVAPAPPPPPAPKPVDRVTIPAGTVATIRMIDAIDSSRNRPGEEFAATLDAPIVVGDRVVVQRSADARVRLVNARSAGRMSGQSELQLELVGLTVNGTAYATESGHYQQHGASRGQRTAETVGGGAVLGALIGAIAGHGKGAAIGSAVGAAGGTAVEASTHGQQIKVPSETKLDFTLTSPVTVTMGRGE